MVTDAKADGDSLNGGYFQYVRQEIERLVPPDVTTVLELGCGAGSTVAWLRTIRPIRFAAGVEVMPTVARRARAIFDEVEVCDAEQAQFAFSVSQFDLVLALDVLEHLTDPQRAVRRLRDMVAPNGLLIVSIPNIAHFEVSLPLFLFGRWDYQDDGLLDKTHLRFFTRKTACRLLEDSGFCVTTLLCNKKFPNLFGLFGLSGQRWRWYNRKILGGIPWRPSHLFDFQFLIAARKQDSAWEATPSLG